jgi:hypothetical protein
LIGTELNSLLNVVPTFVETYGIYKYTTGADWKHAKDTSIIRENILFNGLENLDSLTHREKLATSCEDSKYLAILIQHLKKVFSVKQMIEHKTSTIRNEFIQYDLPYVLFQIYFTLDMLKNEFTHYDLHWSNVLLYVPLSHSHYIHYHYHTRYGKTISFKSTYMAKIIDYGRCYVDKISKKTREELCDERACNDWYTECGESNGYGWLNNKRKDTNRDFIYSQKRNKSHDLRLLKMLTHDVKQGNQKLYDMVFDKIVYDHYYGTKEMTRSGLPQNKIQNVSDAYEMLEKYVELSDVKLLNKEIYDDSTFHKLGDLHIHADFGPMRFIENKIIVDENT